MALNKLMNEFYTEILSMSDSIHSFPASIDRFLYDPRFNDEAEFDDDIEMLYRPIFESIDGICKYGWNTYPVCDSSDIDEDIECGDYDYIIGKINDECPFMYHRPSHPFEFPSRVILYGFRYQIEVDSSKHHIEIYETVQSVRNLFYLEIFDEKIYAIKNMLINSDRPVLLRHP